MPSKHLMLCHHSSFLFNISRIRVFSKDLILHPRWPKYWSISNRSSNEYSGMISFRIDWFDLFAVQETLKNLLQHHSSKTSVLQQSAFFIVQLSHPYMTNLDSILKSRDITLSTKVHLVKAMVFPVVMYGCESWTVEKAGAEELMLLNCGVGEDS